LHDHDDGFFVVAGLPEDKKKREKDKQVPYQS